MQMIANSCSVPKRLHRVGNRGFAASSPHSARHKVVRHFSPLPTNTQGKIVDFTRDLSFFCISELNPTASLLNQTNRER